MLRRIAEIVLGPLVVHRRLPAFVGSGMVVASAKAGGLRYLLRTAINLDPVLYKIVSSIVMSGDVVWDVGGNVGLFAAAAAGLAGKNGSVYAIEADTDTYALLGRTARIQPKATHAKITILHAAIFSQCGSLEFCIAKRSRSANFISGFGTTQTGGVAETRIVPALTLDVLLDSFPGPQVLKIDVEGAEVPVLSGAKRLLTTVRPIIFIEVAGEVSHEVAGILRDYGYSLYDGETFAEIDNANGATSSTVAIPSESNFQLVTVNHAQ